MIEVYNHHAPMHYRFDVTLFLKLGLNFIICLISGWYRIREAECSFRSSCFRYSSDKYVSILVYYAESTFFYFFLFNFSFTCRNLHNCLLFSCNVHRWCHDIGREQAANKPLLKTVFQVCLKLYICMQLVTSMSYCCSLSLILAPT